MKDAYIIDICAESRLRVWKTSDKSKPKESVAANAVRRLGDKKRGN